MLSGRADGEDLDGLGDALLRTCDALVVVARPDGALVSANPAARALLGDGAVEPVVALAGARGAAELLGALGRVARAGTGLTCSTSVASGAALARTFAWALSPVPGPGDLVSLVGVDITATTRQLDDLEARTCTDELTGLANRTGLQRALTERAGTGAHLLFCDLTGCKAAAGSRARSSMAVLERGLDPLEALARADAAMYGAKPSRTSASAVVRAPH